MAGGFGEFLGQFFRGAAGAEDGVHLRVWNELRPWVASLVPAATQKWLPRIASGMLCEIPLVRRGHVVGECDRFGVAACDICLRPTCLHHGRIDQHGDIICYDCIADAQQVVPPYRRERARREQEPPKPRSQRERSDARQQQRQERQQEQQGSQAGHQQAPPPKPQVDPLKVSAALQLLGLLPGASWASIEAAHRKLSGANHPDKFASKSRREQKTAHDRFVAVQQARDLLRKVYEK